MNVTYKWRIEPEDVPLKGNVLASGDDVEDAKAEQWVRDQLNTGNEAAWCMAVVEATLEVDGETFVGDASLGCCSYESEADLRQQVERDLQEEAFQDLLTHMEEAVKRGEVAESVLKLHKKN